MILNSSDKFDLINKEDVNISFVRKQIDTEFEEVKQVLPNSRPEVIAKDLDIVMNIDISSRMKYIKCPTILITSDKDLLGRKEYSERLHKTIKNSTMLILQGV